MTGGDDTEERVEGVLSKLETGVRLDPDDIIFVVFHRQAISDYGDSEGCRDDVDDAIPSGVGHGAYVEILRRLKHAGVIGEIRQDLVNPALHPDDFERTEVRGSYHYSHIRIGEKASEGVGYIHPPDKRPTSLWRLETSVLNYLFCTGRGFRLDPEMIYDYETDYGELLRAAIDCTNLDEYRLTVDVEEGPRYNTVHISLSVAGDSYSTEFETGGDWVRPDALNPAQTAVDDHTSQTIHYHTSGGNDGWILVLESKYEELFKRLS
ncbi:hypothetical protein [Halosimplex pelagicum]|uniref:Uncharacterized protein n=1 Tax=Halosimplex pelagicum TaxID=869886 RepID=A0A7D5PDI8_9EURY|nr:hypothetical protein [Halosimplex pelagicum]QLH83618.1 hypothetical protein HZS54_19150 [Halosimplex pelagicum]